MTRSTPEASYPPGTPSDNSDPIAIAIRRVVACVTCHGQYPCSCPPPVVADSIPVVTHSGTLSMGGVDLKVHILSNGTRIVEPEGINNLLRELWATR